MTLEEVAAQAARKELLLIDTQDPHGFARAHPVGAYNLPFRRQAYGATARLALADWDRPVAVLAEQPAVADAAATALEAAGYEVAARLGGGIASWQAAGLQVVQVADITVDALKDRLDDVQVVDVREPYEWRTGVIENAMLLPMSELEQRVSELDPAREYAIVCASGSRSSLAAATLAERGYRVANLVGGMALWLGAGHPTRPVQ